MRKLFRKIHLWLSVPLGLVITLICFSGATLVFEKEITEALNPQLYQVESKGRQPLPLDRLAAQVAATLPDSVELTGITVSTDAGRPYQANLSKPRRASLMVDQYSGQVLGRTERPAFFAKMFGLHRWLLDSPSQGGPSVGKIVVGISTILFVLALITGIVVWWPRMRRALKPALTVTARHGWRRFWHSLHTAGGMYALVLLLAMGLTGLTWSFGWYRTGFYALFGVSQPAQSGHGEGAKGGGKPGEKGEGRRGGKPDGVKGERRAEGEKADRKGRPGGPEGAEGEKPQADFTRWQQVLDQLKRENPHYEQITVQAGKASVVNSHYGNTRASDRYEYDEATGAIIERTPYAKAEAAQKMRGWIFAVHTGAFGGFTTRVLFCLAALLGATLPLTGYYLWFKRLAGRRRRR